MTRAQEVISGLRLVTSKSETYKGFELWAHMFEEPIPEEPGLSPRRRGESIHVYVTRGAGKELLAKMSESYKLPRPDVVDARFGICAYFEQFRPFDKTIERGDDLHFDTANGFHEEVFAIAFQIAKNSIFVGEIGPANPDHIQLLAREAVKRHKHSMSVAADLFGPMYFRIYSSEKLTIAESRASRVLEAFYMLHTMGVRANHRQIIAECWGYSDNQVKAAFALLKKRAILSQRERSISRTHGDQVG
jgi:hypothetical protein